MPSLKLSTPPSSPLHTFIDAACACAGGERVHVAIVTFDATVHFFSLRAEQSAPQMLVMPDAAQPYCPAATSSLIVPLHESRPLVRSRSSAPPAEACRPLRRSLLDLLHATWPCMLQGICMCCIHTCVAAGTSPDLLLDGHAC